MSGMPSFVVQATPERVKPGHRQASTTEPQRWSQETVETVQQVYAAKRQGCWSQETVETVQQVYATGEATRDVYT